MSSVLSLFSKIVLTSKTIAQSKTPDAPTTRRRSAPEGSGPLRPTPAPYLSQQNLLSDVVRVSETDNSIITRRPSTVMKKPSIFQRYKIVQRIGEGQFGEVFAVKVIRQQQGNDDDEMHHQFATGMKASSSEDKFYACKIIDIATSTTASPGQDETFLDDVMQEISMMLESTHPNVQNLVDFSIENNKAYIVSSLCRGGDLAQALKLRGCLCEEDAKAVMAGILRGLSYLHSRGIAHRDIKLENILLSNSSHDMSDVKIIDMGLAKKVSGFNATPGGAIDTLCGTPFYIAPELIKTTLMKAAGITPPDDMARFVGTPADMWSCGVILYSLLSGYLPFDTDGKESMIHLFEDINNAAYDFSDPVWSMVSGEALSLVESLLQVDPSKRLTAEEALRHPWMAI